MGSAASAAAPAPLTPEPKLLTSEEHGMAITELLRQFRSAFGSQINPNPDVDQHGRDYDNCGLIAKQVVDLSDHPNFSSSFPFLAEGVSNTESMREALQKYFYKMRPIWHAEYDERQRQRELKKKATSP
jgi:hypothetical protein